MSTQYAIIIFLLSLVLSAISSQVLASNLEKVGARLNISEGLLGIITALGADTPEISSAVTALLADQHDLGLGVVIGSNIFNIAALLGLSAIIAGKVSIGHSGLFFNGGVGLLVTAIAAALVLGYISAATGVIILAVLLVPYTILSAMRSTQLEQLNLPPRIEAVLCLMVEQVSKDARKDQTPPNASMTDALSLIPALVSIVLGSVGMVKSAVVLAKVWNVPHVILGTLILATLTGIPNIFAAVRLAVHGRGSAVVSEALNSNTLNVVSGIALTGLFLGLGAPSTQTFFAVWWLLGMTAVALVLFYFRGGLHRGGGWVTIILYLVFVGVIVFWR